jgi:hypothetical protein
MTISRDSRRSKPRVYRSHRSEGGMRTVYPCAFEVHRFEVQECKSWLVFKEPKPKSLCVIEPRDTA